MQLTDVVVVGAGPAGASAARVAAEQGIGVVLLEKQRLPRYKLCGGGLIGLSLASLPAGFAPPVVNEARTASFTYRLGRERVREGEGVLIPMVMRSEFDAGLVELAANAGVDVRDGVSVESLREEADHVVVMTDHGEVRARCVVGADGSASRIARYVGARYAQVDLGLEVELAADDAARDRWQGRVLLDFGTVPGGYAWIFPKGDRLTVGAIAERGRAAEQREYVRSLIARFGLSGLESVYDGGHLTRCRADDSPLARGRVLLAGDAAGLLEPWTREGISYALRSGGLAGLAAAGIASGDADAARAYEEAISGCLATEMAAGTRALRAYQRHPWPFYAAMARTRVGWRAFERLSRGETTLDRALHRAPVRSALSVLGG